MNARSLWRTGRTRTALCLLLLASACSAADHRRVEEISVPAPALASSILPNPTEVPALVLLPPGYHESARRYPVVYYLSGFTTDVTEYVDGTFDGFHMGRALDRSAERGNGAEMILVVVHGRNDLGGSFYVNSPVTGRWEDHVLEDLLPFVETRYRTLPGPACRGIAGDSMGGFGALNFAMRHPERFGSVFALSPNLFDERGLEDLGILSDPYVEAWLIQEERMASWPAAEAAARLASFAEELQRADWRFARRRLFAYAYGAAFAPDPAGRPPFVAFPFSRKNGRIVVDADRVEKLRAGIGDLEEKVRRYGAAFRSLRGIGFDIGRNDRLDWVPRGARRLSRLLLEAGIPNQITEHDGGHNDRLGERIESEMIPFFSRTLCGEKAEAGKP